MGYSFETEIAIIGSGPAGVASSFFLSKNKVPHLIFDKEVFPRDKVCGDGLTPKTIHVIQKMDAKILDQMLAAKDIFAPTDGGFVSNTLGDEVTLPMEKVNGSGLPMGFVARRVDFDYFLTQQLDKNYAKILHGCPVTQLIKLNNGIEILYSQNGSTYKAFAKCVIGADGDRSIVKKTFTPYRLEPKYYSAGIRAYAKNVKGLKAKNLLEFHFVDEIIPGYFWIFPLADGTTANIGIGMLSDYVSKNNVNLRKALEKVIKENPYFKERFMEATFEDDKISGWGLPLGSKWRTLAGDRFMLVGDAASLIDPATGEGIGNALYSGMLAGEAAAKAFNEDSPYNANFLHKYYSLRVHRTMGNELKASTFIQFLGKHPKIINFIIKKAGKNQFFLDNLANYGFKDGAYKKLLNPIFMFRLIKGFF